MPIDGNKTVFLDRDGTINIEKHYLYRVSDFEYIEGAVEGLRKLSDMGYLLVVVTNQSGIARGFYTEEDYRILDEWMKADLLKKGIQIAGSYYCPHLPDGIVKKFACECECRKPKTGLYWQPAKELNINMDMSFAIGDKMRDLSICGESGVKGILISDTVQDKTECIVCSSWKDVVQIIKNCGI